MEKSRRYGGQLWIYWIGSRGQPKGGGSAAWGWGRQLTSLHSIKLVCYEMLSEGGKLLWTRWWTFGLHKSGQFFDLLSVLLACKEVLSSMQLVNENSWNILSNVTVELLAVVFGRSRVYIQALRPSVVTEVFRVFLSRSRYMPGQFKYHCALNAFCLLIVQRLWHSLTRVGNWCWLNLTTCS